MLFSSWADTFHYFISVTNRRALDWQLEELFVAVPLLTSCVTHIYLLFYNFASDQATK